MRRQINEFELEALYKCIGSSIWHLQYVEDSLVPLIIILGIVKELNSIDENEFAKLEVKYKKLTLGQLLGKVKELNILPPPITQRLSDFNDERKWIVHNSLFESGDSLYTDEGRSAVFARLNDFVDEAKSIQKQIGKIITDYSVKKGMNRDRIEIDALNQIGKLKGET